MHWEVVSHTAAVEAGRQDGWPQLPRSWTEVEAQVGQPGKADLLDAWEWPGACTEVLCMGQRSVATDQVGV